MIAAQVAKWTMTHTVRISAAVSDTEESSDILGPSDLAQIGQAV
jgi:hypothetical protein